VWRPERIPAPPVWDLLIPEEQTWLVASVKIRDEGDGTAARIPANLIFAMYLKRI
jgi:hypothetical protein